ncbi:MAG: PQQ-like beta-propeller repeat protein, partial [candidate division KSB1 bacterium]|nr:PQQ-like beta-propeller repeat protein [candidate division KSB1 bacterium]
PKLLWQADGLGQGYTSAAVTEQRVYVTGQFDGVGRLFAFDLQGKKLWEKDYGPEWTRNYPGTRSTPVVTNDRLYLLSGQGVLYCLSLEGETLWTADLYKRFGGIEVEWGIAEQLLVDGNTVYCTPGGKTAMAALDRLSGKTLWTCAGNGESSSYCSPILVKHNGIPMLITALQKSIIGVHAQSGELLWRYPHTAPYDIHANTPIYHDGAVFFHSGETGTGALLQISADGRTVRPVWQSDRLDALIGHYVLIDGFIYGAGYSNGGFTALDWRTGAVGFDDRTLVRRAAVITADGMIYAYSENGAVSLIKPDPKTFRLISTFKIKQGSGPHWAHPVIKNGRLYIRHGEVMLVYDLSRPQ